LPAWINTPPLAPSIKPPAWLVKLPPAARKIPWPKVPVPSIVPVLTTVPGAVSISTPLKLPSIRLELLTLPPS
jgi:hypothetical protein